jgi:hypothetical protein
VTRDSVFTDVVITDKTFAPAAVSQIVITGSVVSEFSDPVAAETVITGAVINDAAIPGAVITDTVTVPQDPEEGGMTQRH